jgi:hypothetical protein
LAARSERPDGSRTAEKRDELAPPHVSLKKRALRDARS